MLRFRLSHGLGDDEANARLLSDIERLSAHVRRARPFHDVRAETLREDWPEKRVAAESRIRDFLERSRREGRRVLVVPYRVAGFGPYEEILKGWDYVADGRGFLPHANIGRWIEERIQKALSD